MGLNETDQPSSSDQVSFHTPFDDLIPKLEDSEAQFYLDSIRIYLGLCEGTITMDTAFKAVELLKQNPEYTAFPINPTYLSINQQYKMKLIENLKTLKKFNLFTKSSIKSAYNFAFLIEEAPITSNDLSILSLLSKDPTISLVKAADILKVAPRTVARSIDRLHERNQLRITYLVDFSAFNLQSVIMFFTLRDGFDWQEIEQSFSHYPFTKSILKTTMTDVGYVTFLIPNYDANIKSFDKSLTRVGSALFDYLSIHHQTSTGTTCNVDLYHSNAWHLPDHMENILEEDIEFDPDTAPPLMFCSGVRPELKIEDYIVASQAQMNARDPPSKVSESLGMKGFDYDAKTVSSILRRLQTRSLLLPYVVFALPKLSSNFVFEIVCNSEVKPRILETIGRFPWVLYYLSSRGIVVWMMCSGDHQVEYYQLFRALEKKPGVHSVNPIMTISQRGSRSMFDLTRALTYQSGHWSANPEDIDISRYIE